MKIVRSLKELCKDSEQQESEYHMDSLDGLRGAMTFIVVYFHLQIFYSQLDVQSSVSAYLNAFPIGGFFLQSSLLLKFKMLDDLFKIRADHPQSTRAISLVISVYFARRFFRLYVPYFMLCTMLSMLLTYLGNLRFSLYDSNRLDRIN